MTGPNNYTKTKTRRPNLTIAEVDAMKAEEAAGHSRKQIATDHNCTAACVSRRLGTKRAYKQRAKATEAQAVVEE